MNLSFKQRFHVVRIEGNVYCLFVSQKGLHYLALEEEDVLLVTKIKAELKLSRVEQAAALDLLYKLALCPVSA